jgi:tetratricopeptide (TPR) repeat protein
MSMRLKLLTFTVAALCLIGPASVADATTTAQDAANAAASADLLRNPRGCGVVGSALDAASVEDMIRVDGFGEAVWQVDTTNPEAQAWFDHGVRLRWAFEHKEAVRAFRRAGLIDPECGMCAWGEAWAIGPNLNGGGNDEASLREGRRLAQLARRKAGGATATQRQMIDALIQRYSGTKASQGVRFARAMDRIARRLPNDPMISAVTADAWMIQADEWWDEDGKAKDRGITRAMQILETSLAGAPNDPGTIHLYIHLTEWSDDPHKAIPFGERLALLAPSASHLVHMPSHTFYRVGRYADAMRSNVNAVALDKRYNELARPPGGVPGMALHAHNIHFGMGGALMAGGAEEGLVLADGFLATYPDIATTNLWRQLMANDAYAIYGRFGTPEQVAALAQPPADRPLLRASWHYGRGEAAARAGDAAAVRIEAEAIRTIREAGGIAGDQAEDMNLLMEVSQRVLEGRAAMIEGNPRAAVAAFTRAAEIQGMEEEGGDPPIIWYPTRRSLAAAMLASGDAAGAKAKIEELLSDWPMDPYSYFVLAEAEAALGYTAAAEAARARAGVEWVGGEMSLKLA